jgi:hypothetical protein
MQEQSEPRACGKPMWLLWSWSRSDALPICESVSGVTVEGSTHVELLSQLMGIPPAALSEQLWLGHRAYLARLRTLPAACGWSATGAVALLGGRGHVTRPTKQPVLPTRCATRYSFHMKWLQIGLWYIHGFGFGVATSRGR